ncbi:MAG: RidA family protein [Saprospiraceae bacterium]|nr:RidA family protein [Saprospiraceae bacterium]
MRANYSTGAKWEPLVGYSRAVRMGDVIEVSGTVAMKDGAPYGIDDPYQQTQRILEIIGEALAYFGASYEHVIRTRMYVTNVDHWEAVGKAHGEVFGDIRPATSLVQVSALIAPEYLVEIEATAIAPQQSMNLAGAGPLPL